MRRNCWASDGAPGNAASVWPALSADGRSVAFYSDASNLVSGDTNGSMDVFIRVPVGALYLPLVLGVD